MQEIWNKYPIILEWVFAQFAFMQLLHLLWSFTVASIVSIVCERCLYYKIVS